MQPRYQKKLQQLNKQTKDLKQKMAVAQSKVISRGQKKPTPKPDKQADQFTTPIKKQNNTTTTTDNTADTANKDKGGVNDKDQDKDKDKDKDGKNGSGDKKVEEPQDSTNKDNKTIKKGGDFILDDIPDQPLPLDKKPVTNTNTNPSSATKPTNPSANTTSTMNTSSTKPNTTNPSPSTNPTSVPGTNPGTTTLKPGSTNPSSSSNPTSATNPSTTTKPSTSSSTQPSPSLPKTKQQLQQQRIQKQQQQLIKKQQQQQTRKQQQQKRKQQQQKRKQQQQLRLQKQQQLRKQRQQQQQKQKQQQQQRIQQFQQFITYTHSLRDQLQQKARFVQLQYQKQSIYWNEQRNKYENQIQKLNNKIQEKDKKIQTMLDKIAELKQHLKIKVEECQEKGVIIAGLKKIEEELRQENVKIVLENKNLKADNKVVIGHLDKLLAEQRKDHEKTAREIFDAREKRVIDSLYHKTMEPVVTQTSRSYLPSQRNQLTNKLKLQKTLEQYAHHREQSNRKIYVLQRELSKKQQQVQQLQRKVRILEQSMRKLNQLRDLQRNNTKKQTSIIVQYEKNYKQIALHNESLSQQLQKYYKIPRMKQKIGVISRSKRIKQNEAI